MNGLESILAHPAVQGTAVVLLHFLWQGAAIALLLALTLSVLPRENAAARFRAAVGAMGLLFLAPVATAVVLVLRDTGAAVMRAGSYPLPVPGGGEALSMTPLPIVASPIAHRLQPTEPWLAALVFLWVAGVVLLSVRNLNGYAEVRFLTRMGTSAPPAEWTAVLRKLSANVGVTRTVRLLGSTLVRVPTVIGWMRPVILVPVGAFTGLHPRHLEAILAHELAHVRRHDYLLNLVQTCVETLLFYHPAVWWVSRQIRREREHCCDDIAAASCGDAVVVARALAEMEAFRGAGMGLAMRADGGSLVARVARLVGASPRGRSGDRWVPVALVMASTLGMLFLGTEALRSPSNAALADEQDTPGETEEWDVGRRGDNEGTWRAEYREGHLTVHVRYGDSDWTMGSPVEDFGVTASQVETLLRRDTIDVDFPRDAGVFHFAGSVTSRGRTSKARGEFTFEPDPEYVDALRDLGYSRGEVEAAQMELAGHDVSLRYIKEMAGLGHERLPLYRLVEFKIHGISTQYVRRMHEAGYENLSAERLVEFKIHGISPEYVSGLVHAGYQDLAADRLVEFKIHGISPDYVEGMTSAGYSHMDPSRIVEFKIHGISPDYVNAMTSAGYAHLDPERMVEFRIHGISPDYVKGLVQAGYADLAPDRLVEFRIHGISPDYAAHMREAGLRDLPPDKLVEFRIHGVTPELVEDLRQRGLDDLTPDEILEIKIQGLNRYLKRMK